MIYNSTSTKIISTLKSNLPKSNYYRNMDTVQSECLELKHTLQIRRAKNNIVMVWCLLNHPLPRKIAPQPNINENLETVDLNGPISQLPMLRALL